MKGARILIVEDEKIVAKTLERRLREIGYVVTAVVSSGEEAVRKAAETAPDLILMDIRLQGEVDGIEAASRIRSRLDVPVVYLTAHADETTVERATATEPFGYILKPFGEYNVYVAVETALYKHRAERSLRESERFVRAAIDALSACLAVLDEQGAVLAVNRAWRDTAPAPIPWAENLKGSTTWPSVTSPRAKARRTPPRWPRAFVPSCGASRANFRSNIASRLCPNRGVSWRG
ncbi:MAG: response regulator [Thermodesulfobacteriota bacterium]|jgi:CheY-like chemotaxis protein